MIPLTFLLSSVASVLIAQEHPGCFMYDQGGFVDLGAMCAVAQGQQWNTHQRRENFKDRLATNIAFQLADSDVRNSLIRRFSNESDLAQQANTGLLYCDRIRQGQAIGHPSSRTDEGYVLQFLVVDAATTQLCPEFSTMPDGTSFASNFGRLMAQEGYLSPRYLRR